MWRLSHAIDEHLRDNIANKKIQGILLETATSFLRWASFYSSLSLAMQASRCPKRNVHFGSMYLQPHKTETQAGSKDALLLYCWLHMDCHHHSMSWEQKEGKLTFFFNHPSLQLFTHINSPHTKAERWLQSATYYILIEACKISSSNWHSDGVAIIMLLPKIVNLWTLLSCTCRTLTVFSGQISFHL